MSAGNGLDIFTSSLGPQDVRAREVNRVWVQWNGARRQILETWNEVQRYVWATSTKDTTNESVTDFSNTTHRPKMANLYDTLTINYDAALFPNDDWLKWKGNDSDAANKEKREIVEAYMKTKHAIAASNFRNTMRQLESDWVIYGNAFAEVEYVREWSVDPLTGQITPSYMGPRIIRRDPREIVFNPLATSFRQAPKITRDLYTMAELTRLAQDNPGNEKWTKILELAQEHRGIIRQWSQGDIDKDLNLQFDGFGTTSEYFDSGLIEVLSFYGDLHWGAVIGENQYERDRQIVVVDRWSLALDQEIDTWNGKPHIYHVPWRERSDNLWGQGPLENLVGIQYRIDHLENARADAFDQMLDPDIVFQGDVEDIMQIGGAKHYYIAENGNIQYLRPDTTVLNADLQIKELTESMEMFALSPREALGFRTPGEKTLGEFQGLTNAAARSFQHKVTIYQEFLEQIVNAELEVSVRNLDGTDMVEIIDNDTGAAQFKTITKSDITSNGRLIPVGARHFARESQLVQNLQALQAGPLADPEVAMHFSSIGLAELYKEWMDLAGGAKELVTPYVRVEERLEAQRRTQVAEDQAIAESQTDVVGDLDAGTEEQQGLPVGEITPG
jgi:hypothetical protein